MRIQRIALILVLSLFLTLVLTLGIGLALVASSADEQSAEAPAMTQDRLESLLRALVPGADGVPGAVSFVLNGVQIECISDVDHDRMRLIATIAPVSKLTGEQVGRVLEANFHTALDARYATSNGLLYAAFIHPLSPLTERELRSAVVQVSNLARAFGTTYSSGELEYRGESPPI